MITAVEACHMHRTNFAALFGFPSGVSQPIRQVGRMKALIHLSPVHLRFSMSAIEKQRLVNGGHKSQSWWQPYWQLARMHKFPSGSILVFWPCGMHTLNLAFWGGLMDRLQLGATFWAPATTPLSCFSSRTTWRPSSLPAHFCTVLRVRSTISVTWTLIAKLVCTLIPWSSSSD